MAQQKRERKLTRLNTLPPVRRTKGPSKSREEFAGPAQPCGGWRQGGGERGRLGPKDRSPYRTANRPPVSNQRPPEILDGRHTPGGSWRHTGHTHPTSAGGDWGWGRGEQKARHTRGECARQASGCLSRSDREDTKCRCSFLFRAFVEHPRAGTARSAAHAPYRAAGSLSSVEGKAVPAPSRSETELATRIRVHLRPPV